MEILKSVWIYSLILNKEDYLFFRLVFARKAEITIRFAEIKKTIKFGRPPYY